MGRKKKTPNRGTLNSELMQRIDNMDDKMDFDPYQPIKRTTMETDELFDDSTYDKSKEEEQYESGASTIVVGVIVGLLMALTLGGLLIFVLH